MVAGAFPRIKAYLSEDDLPDAPVAAHDGVEARPQQLGGLPAAGWPLGFGQGGLRWRKRDPVSQQQIHEGREPPHHVGA